MNNASSKSMTAPAVSRLRGDEPLSMEELLERYKEEDPGVFSVGGTFGIDSTAFGLEVNNVYVSVVNVLDEEGEYDGRLLVVQGMAHFHIAKLFKASAALIGEYDPDALTDPLDLFNREMDDDEKEEAVRSKNAFATLSGDTVTHYSLVGDAAETNGLYYLYDASDALLEKQTVFVATGLVELSWLEKIGVNCGLKVGVIGAYNSFEDSWEVGVGAKFTVSSGREWMVIGRIGFKGGLLNTISLEVNGEVPIGPVVFTRIKIGATGIAETVQTYSPALGVAFGPEVNFGDLVNPVAKVLGLKVGSFHVVEVDVAGDVSSDFNDVNLSVEGKLFGLLEIKGGWQRENGDYNEISLSVGTKNSSTFNFCISGAVGWSSNQLTVKASLDGSFKWDFTALGITWVGVNVGGGISFVYNENYSRKTLSVAVNGRANVKVAFIKVGVNVSKSWFFDLSQRRGYDCENTELLSTGRPANVGERVQLRGEPEAVANGEVIGTYSWTADEFAASGRMYITIAAQYSLNDVEWVLYTPDGDVHYSESEGKPVQISVISYSQWELAVDKPAQGAWTIDVYGSKKWNGEVLIYAEAGDPIETDLRILSVGTSSITIEYEAHATGDNYLAAIYMERAGKAEDDYEGTVLEYLEATGEGEYRQATIELPEDVQGGDYRFYIMAQSTNSAEIAYSAKTDAVNLARRTADLVVTGYRVEFQADRPELATAVFTIENLGTLDANDFTVEVLLGENKIGIYDDVVLCATSTSLLAGGSQTMQLVVEIPEEYLGEQAVMSVRLNGDGAVDEGIFKNDNIAMKTLSFFEVGGEDSMELLWDSVDGASSYAVEYALEGNWSDAVTLSGVTGTSLSLDLAAGNYAFRVTPYDADGIAIEEEVMEWNGNDYYEEDFSLAFAASEKTASTEEFLLQDGLYDWSGLDLGNFTGTLTLNLVDGIHEGKDATVMTVNVVNGIAQEVDSLQGVLYASGLYYFTATRQNNQAAEELSFTVTGDLFPNLEAERGIVSLPDSVDENGCFSELIVGWVGAYASHDVWDYLLEDAGTLRISVKDFASITGDIAVELYVQSDYSGDYSKVKSITVTPDMESEVILDDFLVKNNFYVQVRALAQEPETGDTGKWWSSAVQNSCLADSAYVHSTVYSLEISYNAFDDEPLDADEWMLFAGDGIAVDGWVGYGNTEDSYLLVVDDDKAGKYQFALDGDAKEARIKITSIAGNLIKSATINNNGNATLSNIDLYAGAYIVNVSSVRSSKNTNNTDYTLTVNQTKSYGLITAGNAAMVENAAKGEKLMFAVDVEEDGVYDVSELLSAGLKVSFHEARTSGKLGNIQLSRGHVELSDDEISYMKVYGEYAAWGDAAIGLDAENRRFTYTSLAQALS